jgi:hypothetical protein
MQFKRIFLATFFTFFFFLTFSQQGLIHYTVIDWSFSFFNSEPTDIARIRGSVASYASENTNKGLKCISFRGTTGLKYETLFLNGRIGLATGLRYSEFMQNTGKWFLLTQGANYFYFLYKQDQNNTYYAQVKSILQTSGYLGIPVEFSFFPLASPHYCRFYMKLGAETDIRLNTRTTVNLRNDYLSSMKAEVARRISNPSSFGYSLYNCLGIRAGHDGKPTLSLELFVPILNSNPGSAGLLKNRFGGGLQFNLHIPIKSINE